jgi:hypothetical protein
VFETGNEDDGDPDMGSGFKAVYWAYTEAGDEAETEAGARAEIEARNDVHAHTES